MNIWCQNCSSSDDRQTTCHNCIMVACQLRSLQLQLWCPIIIFKSLQHAWRTVWKSADTRTPTDPSHKSHNASDKYSAMHHFVTESRCVTKWCIVRYGTGAFWDLSNRSIGLQRHYVEKINTRSCDVTWALRLIPEILTKTPECITEKLDTHSFSGFSNYMKNYYIRNYKANGLIENCFICQN